ncbi:polyamine oxidase [Streptococcus suis]|nr:polyamine oxidase [Streptococcus suis]
MSKIVLGLYFYLKYDKIRSMRGFVQKRVKQACLIVFCRKHARKISEKIGDN